MAHGLKASSYDPLTGARMLNHVLEGDIPSTIFR